MSGSTSIDWKPAPLKRFLSKNDSGVWGDEPTGVDDYLVLRSTDIALDGSWTVQDPAWRSLEPTESRQALLDEGDLVVVKSSGSAAHLGKTALVTDDVAKMEARFANFVQRLRPARNAYPRYLWYLLNSSFARRQLELLGTTTTGLRNLNAEIIGSIKCPGPPRQEQQAIADFLDAETARIDALIAKKRQLTQLLNTRLASLARNLIFTQTNVKKVRLGCVVSILPGYAFSSSDFRDDGEDAIRLLRGINVAPGRCRWEEVAYLPEPQMHHHQAYMLSAGDLVLGMDRPFISEGTRLATIKETDVPALLVQRVARIRTKKSLNPKYLSFALHSDVFRDHCTPITTGVSVPHISADQIADFRVPMPERKVQDRIADRLANEETRANTFRDRFSRQVDLLAEHRQALITAAVTGQLEVPEGAIP